MKTKLEHLNTALGMAVEAGAPDAFAGALTVRDAWARFPYAATPVVRRTDRQTAMPSVSTVSGTAK